MTERRMTEGRKLPKVENYKVEKTERRKRPSVEKDCINILFYEDRKYLIFNYTYSKGRKRVNISSKITRIHNLKNLLVTIVS
jgi:hypothetical protein